VNDASLWLLSWVPLGITVMVAALGFMVSATLGIGGVVLLIPVLSLWLPPSEAVAISAPVMLVNNIGKTWVYGRHVDWTACMRVSVLGVPCAFLAALFVVRLDDRFISLGLAVFIVLTVVLERSGLQVRVGPRALVGWGALTGVISGLCGAAGPPTAIGLRGYGLHKEAFVATVAVFAIGLQLAKIPAYWRSDLLQTKHVPLMALLSLVAAASVMVGPPLLKRLPTKSFRNGMDAVLLLSALWMILDVIF
jgi:uncharacterized protein